ncbi:hypothetical protein EXU34_18180 [Alteromonas sp. ZYF713]|nr:hypothetical protein [Alteromonas sp. ZYF713]
MKFKIHVGPPKTGTSAIQRWCLEHRDILLANGVLYPSHDIDENGVSSGNLLTLFERNETAGLIFSHQKLDDLKRQAESLGVETVLLSSEFFFKQIPVLADAIPDATFVAYIRFELSLLESGYNQSVKRHGMAEPLRVPDTLKSSSLALISQYVKRYGEAMFNLRAYGQDTFDGGSIVSDLMAALSVSLKSNELLSGPKKINTGYSLEGLEFKRWFNKFSASFLQNQMDKFLQCEAEKADLAYSVLSGSDFWRLRKSLLRELKVFCRDHDVRNKKRLIEEAEAFKQSKVRMQHIGLNCFKNLTRQFLNFDASNSECLQRFVDENKGQLQSSEDTLRLQEIQFLLSNTNEKKTAKKPELTRFYGYASRKISQLASRLILNTVRQTSLQKKNNSRGNLTIKEQSDDEVILSFDIPFVGSENFANVLTRTYGQNKIYVCNKINYKRLQQIGLPQDTKAVHGHASIVSKISGQFPQATNICWVRDPLERLWRHYQSILLNEYPNTFYEKLMNLSARRKIVNDKYLFVAMLEDPDFLSLREVYSRCIGAKIHSFDFVGSVANYDNDIKKLEKILGASFKLVDLNIKSKQSTLPPDLLKYKSVLKTDYDLVDSYL